MNFYKCSCTNQLDTLECGNCIDECKIVLRATSQSSHGHRQNHGDAVVYSEFHQAYQGAAWNNPVGWVEKRRIFKDNKSRTEWIGYRGDWQDEETLSCNCLRKTDALKFIAERL